MGRRESEIRRPRGIDAVSPARRRRGLHSLVRGAVFLRRKALGCGFETAVRLNYEERQFRPVMPRVLFREAA